MYNTPRHRRRKMFYTGGAKHILSYMESDYVVRSTTSMRSMLKLGGSGGMPPQENFENYML